MDTGDTGLDECGLLDAARVWVTGHTSTALRGCYIPVGAVFSFSYSDEDSGMDPTLSPAQNPDVTTSATVEPPPGAVAVSPDQHGALGPVVSAPAPQPFGNTLAAETPAPTAESLGDLAQKVDDPVLVVTLAIIALLGVGLWKHLGKVADQKAALDMKKLEIEQMSVKKGQTMTSQPPPCQAANAAIEARLAAFEARLAKTESVSSVQLPGGGSVKDTLEEHDERLRKLELEKFRKGDA